MCTGSPEQTICWLSGAGGRPQTRSARRYLGDQDLAGNGYTA
jgi:hypothetical protein